MSWTPLNRLQQATSLQHLVWRSHDRVYWAYKYACSILLSGAISANPWEGGSIRPATVPIHLGTKPADTLVKFILKSPFSLWGVGRPPDLPLIDATDSASKCIAWLIIEWSKVNRVYRCDSRQNNSSRTVTVNCSNCGHSLVFSQ